MTGCLVFVSLASLAARTVTITLYAPVQYGFDLWWEFGFREMARSIAAERAPVAGGLVQPHGRDRSTATSGNSSGEP